MRLNATLGMAEGWSCTFVLWACWNALCCCSQHAAGIFEPSLSVWYPGDGDLTFVVTGEKQALWTQSTTRFASSRLRRLPMHSEHSSLCIAMLCCIPAAHSAENTDGMFQCYMARCGALHMAHTPSYAPLTLAHWSEDGPFL
jgi:hypothetical protein